MVGDSKETVVDVLARELRLEHPARCEVVQLFPGQPEPLAEHIAGVFAE